MDLNKELLKEARSFKTTKDNKITQKTGKITLQANTKVVEQTIVEKYKYKQNIFNNNIKVTKQNYSNLYIILSNKNEIELHNVCNANKELVNKDKNVTT